jgi:hypothetical protein
MIKDAQGRKWAMRFKQYDRGWGWEARCGNHGQSSGMNLFATKVLAANDAYRTIQGRGAIAVGREYFRRLSERGSECRLTPEDLEAIQRAGSEAMNVVALKT